MLLKVRFNQISLILSETRLQQRLQAAQEAHS